MVPSIPRFIAVCIGVLSVVRTDADTNPGLDSVARGEAAEVAKTGDGKDAPLKEKALRRRIEKTLGKSPKGYFLIAKWQITSEPNKPVTFDATLHVYEGRDQAVNAIIDHLRDKPNGARGFRAAHRFDANSGGKEAANLFRDLLEERLKGVKLPSASDIVAGVLGGDEFEEILTGPKGVRITVVHRPPNSKKPVKVVLAIP